MNGFSTEEETQSGHNQVCCLLDDAERCTRPAGNASYSKRIQKTVAQRKLKLNIDPSLQVNTLRRYKRHYKVPMRPGLNKAELADNLARHFRTIPIAEKEAITFFIYMVKNNRNKLDQKNDPCTS
ncbi:hypothetical protein ISCGN_028221 [Ixodes scapularis]